MPLVNTKEMFQKAYPDAFKANVKMPPAGHFGDSELEIGRVCVHNGFWLCMEVCCGDAAGSNL